MPMPSLPSSINAAKWKSTAKDSDPKGAVFAAIGRVTKAHLAIDPKLLAAPAPKTLDDAAELRKKLDSHAKLVQEAIVAVDALTKAGEAALAGVKSDKSKADVTKLLNSILAEASGYASDVEKTYDNVQADVGDAIDALEAAKKKADAAAEAEGGDDSGKDDAETHLKKLKGTLKDVMKFEAVAGKPSPFRFLIGWGQKAAVFAQRSGSYGPKQVTMLAKHLGLEKCEGYTLGELSYDKATEVYVFSCRGKVPSKKKVKEALKEQVGRPVDILLRKLVKTKSGEEVFEDATDADEEAAGGESPKGTSQPQTGTATEASPGGTKAAAAAALILSKLETFKAKFDQRVALGGEDSEKLKSLDKGIRTAAGAGDPVRAKTLLDGLILLLGSAPRAKQLPELQKAQKAWVDLRRRYASEVKALAASLDSIYREELATKDPAVVKAISTAKVKLNGTAGLIGPELETAVDAVLKAQLLDGQVKASAAAKNVLTALLTRLGSDSVFKSLDGKNNELKPDMTIVTDLQTNLKELRAALQI